MSHSTPAAPRLRTPDRSQLLEPMPIEQLLPPDHTARLVWRFAQTIDLEPLTQSIRARLDTPGRDANDPRLLFALWLYATIDGVGTARELERLCRDHVAYRWLCGGISTNYHSLSDFRVQHGDLLDGLLTEVVAVMLHQELIDLNRVALDGMRVRAHAGKASFHRQATLERCRDEARAQVVALTRQANDDPAAVSRRQRAAQERAAGDREARATRALAELAPVRAAKERRAKGHGEQARASTTDPEARTMKMGDGGYRPAFNVQFATTTEGGAIVGVSVTNQGTDGGLLEPMLEPIQRRVDRLPAEVLIDGGYVGQAAIEAATADGVVVYAPVKATPKQTKSGANVYEPLATDSVAVAAWKQRMGTASAQEVYKERASTAEWSNAQARNRGMQQFVVRGLAKVETVARWYALAHNLTRLWALSGVAK